MDTGIILQAREEFTAVHRPKGKIWDFTDEHFVQVVEWILNRLSYQRITELCGLELKLPPAKIPGFRKLSEFWHSSGFAILLLKLHRRASAEISREMGEEARQSPVDWARQNAEKIQQTTHELLHDPSVDPKVVKTFVTASIKLNDQEIALKRLALLEKQHAEATQTLTDSKLSPAQREARMREIFNVTK